MDLKDKLMVHHQQDINSGWKTDPIVPTAYSKKYSIRVPSDISDT
jgi:hypothetical protein